MYYTWARDFYSPLFVSISLSSRFLPFFLPSSPPPFVSLYSFDPRHVLATQSHFFLQINQQRTRRGPNAASTFIVELLSRQYNTTQDIITRLSSLYLRRVIHFIESILFDCSSLAFFYQHHINLLPLSAFSFARRIHPSFSFFGFSYSYTETTIVRTKH
jgi:hypothetical protein